MNEDGDLILESEDIAKTFTDYLGAIVDNLDLHHEEDKTSSPSNTSDKINDIIKNYGKYSSICNIKTKYRGISNLSLYVIIMSRKSFRVNPHSIVCLDVKELFARSRCHI